MPNSTLSSQTPPSSNDNTTGSIAWLIFGVIGIVVLLIAVVVIGILFLFRRKIFTKCLVDNSRCTADDIDLTEKAVVVDKDKTKDDTAIEESVIEHLQETTVDPEVMDKSSNQHVYNDNATRRYMRDPTMKMKKSKKQSQCYDNIIKSSETRESHSYDYVDQRSLMKCVPDDKTGYINEKPEITGTPTTHTKNDNDDQVRTITKTSKQTEQEIDKTDKPNKSETKRALKISKHPVGKEKTQRAGKGAYHDKTKGSVNPTKKEVEETRSSEMAHEGDLYEVTDLHNSPDINHTSYSTLTSQTEKRQEKTKTSGIVQNEVGPCEEKPYPNIQQNYENFDFEKNSRERNTGTEQELYGSHYANISDTRTPSTSSNDSSSTDTSPSLDEHHGNTKIIIQSASVVLTINRNT